MKKKFFLGKKIGSETAANLRMVAGRSVLYLVSEMPFFVFFPPLQVGTMAVGIRASTVSGSDVRNVNFFQSAYLPWAPGRAVCRNGLRYFAVYCNWYCTYNNISCISSSSVVLTQDPEITVSSLSKPAFLQIAAGCDGSVTEGAWHCPAGERTDAASVGKRRRNTHRQRSVSTSSQSITTAGDLGLRGSPAAKSQERLSRRCIRTDLTDLHA